ncbi:hypothetical protein FXV83_00750 [Bradyrhizobium hipponense]|uniref:Uncharacterized protein n=1 Tax=Bradyrhizobium hipponense TaxID=2605638 RepID=A0A5S4YXR1_9BRAD|nr:hypothetical protein [Bradyrhizobium hipponense]TYO68394.1 hypothetical protein FXV83_00750 [Bradyrhizobium hipponense]
MSEPEAQHEVSPGAPSGHDQTPGQEPPRGKKPGSSRGTWIGIAGGLAIAGIAAFTILPRLGGDKPPGVGEESTLEVLIPADINAALPTLDPGSSKAAVDDAKNCKVPLAWVTLKQQPNGHGGMVRVRSGSYLSPPIKLTPTPQRIALPYPAPYPTGRGVLTLVGEADQVGFYLTPGGIHDVNGTYSVNVHWQVRNPCP